MEKKLVTILTAYQISDIIVAESLLNDAGIQTMVTDELINQLNPLYSNALGGIKLQLREEDFPVAYEILKEGGFLPGGNDPAFTGEKQEPLSNAASEQFLCPYCGSENISNPRLSKTAFAISVLLLGFQLPVFSKERFCFDCRKTFKPD